MGDAKDIDEKEQDRKRHHHEKDAEARRDADELDEAEIVSFLDVVNEIQDGKDPPRVSVSIVSGCWTLQIVDACVPEQCLERSCMLEDFMVDVVEVKKVCSNFSDPVRLHHDNGADIDHGHLPAQERLVFHP